MPARIAFPRYPKTQVQHGIAIHSPAITLAVVEALQASAKLAKTHTSAQALKKLDAIGLNKETINLLLNTDAVKLSADIESLRNNARAQKQMVEKEKLREKQVVAKGGVYLPPVPQKRTQLEQFLTDVGDFTVVFDPNVFRALASRHTENLETALITEKVTLLKAGARGSTMKDLYNMDPATYRNLCRSYSISTRPGRTLKPSADIVKIVNEAWNELCNMPNAFKDYPTLAAKYVALHKYYLPVAIDIATVHLVLFSK